MADIDSICLCGNRTWFQREDNGRIIYKCEKCGMERIVVPPPVQK